MHTAATSSLNEVISPYKTLSVSQTARAACEKHPAFTPLIESFSALFSARGELIESLADKLVRDADCPVPALQQDRLEQGVPVLSDSNIEWTAAYYSEIESSIFVYLENIGTLKPAVAKFKEAVIKGRITLPDMFRAVMNSNESMLRDSALKAEIQPAFLFFITQQILACILGAYATVHAEVLSKIFWREAYCPVCGSFPDISVLQRPDIDQSEFLAGGGGKKMMHCSCCSHQWHFRRGTCPACNNDEAGAIHYFHVEEQSAERVEYCKKCNTYLNNVDLRSSTSTPDLTITPLTLIHLDMKAAQKKLTPLVHTLWNTF
jgi:FdhE protein